MDQEEAAVRRCPSPCPSVDQEEVAVCRCLSSRPFAFLRGSKMLPFLAPLRGSPPSPHEDPSNSAPSPRNLPPGPNRATIRRCESGRTRQPAAFQPEGGCSHRCRRPTGRGTSRLSPAMPATQHRWDVASRNRKWGRMSGNGHVTTTATESRPACRATGRSGVKRWGKSPPAASATKPAGRACNREQGEWVLHGLRRWCKISSQRHEQGWLTPSKLHSAGPSARDR